MELAGGTLNLEALVQSFDVQERTVLRKTDNLNTLFWSRAGSATTDKVPTHLLCLFGIHQRFHRYIPPHDYLAGPSNPIADALSRDFNLEWATLMNTLQPYITPCSSHQVWHLASTMFVDAILVALIQKQ